MRASGESGAGGGSPPVDTVAQAGPVDFASARVGVVLRQKWKLDRLIGSGGMASVYSATHRTGGRAAIKILHPGHAYDEQITRRFLREGYVANQVGHPGAVRILDDDVAEDGTAFIVMELLEGETLEGFCERRGTLAPEEVLRIVDALLDILVAAHAKQIVHRDLKPDNIFITSEGTVKLLDFGIARLRTMNPGSMQTMMGALFGTPPYMAPEQALGRTEQIDGRSDLWAVGAIMFYAVTGRYVHPAQTVTEQIIAQATKHPPPLASVHPGVPRAFAAVVDRALAFDQGVRWPDARSMQEAVREALRAPDEGTLALGATPGPSLSPAAALSIPDIERGSSTGTSALGVSKTVSFEGPKRSGLAGRGVQVGFAAALLAAAAVVVYLVALRPGASDGDGEGATVASAQADAPVAPAGTGPLAVPSPSVAPSSPAASAAAVEPSAAPPSVALPSVAPAQSAAPGAPRVDGPRTKTPPRSGTSASAPTNPPAGNEDWLDRQH